MLLSWLNKLTGTKVKTLVVVVLISLEVNSSVTLVETNCLELGACCPSCRSAINFEKLSNSNYHSHKQTTISYQCRHHIAPSYHWPYIEINSQMGKLSDLEDGGDLRIII